MIKTFTPLGLTSLTSRPPCEIAADIRKAMPTGGKTWVHSRVFVQALETLPSWLDSMPPRAQVPQSVIFPGQVAHMTAMEVGLRFLTNAAGWRGCEADALKNEIRVALGGRPLLNGGNPL